jgi:hypothetical protein
MAIEIRELSMDEIEFVSGAGTTLSSVNLAEVLGTAPSNSSDTVLTSDGGSAIAIKPGKPIFHAP